MSKKNKIAPSIGGQAVIEGIMMKGPEKSTLCVRNSSGEIISRDFENDSSDKWYKKTPIIRGCVGMVQTMMLGYKCLSLSMELSEAFEDETPSKFDAYIDKKFGKNSVAFFSVISGILASFISLFLFMYLPSLLVSFASQYFEIDNMKSILEGVTKISIFVLYLFLVSKLKDMRRVFMYHGAEHKTIFAYEKGEELTVENVRKQSRFHPRCGTNFLLIVLVISITVSSLISWDNLLIRTLLKVVFIPITVGISFEIIKLVGRYNNIFTRFITAPGLWLQRLTTCEPDDSQIEVAIAALKSVIPERKDVPLDK